MVTVVDAKVAIDVSGKTVKVWGSGYLGHRGWGKKAFLEQKHGYGGYLDKRVCQGRGDDGEVRGEREGDGGGGRGKGWRRIEGAEVEGEGLKKYTQKEKG